jgi:hypothetical protein
MDGWMGGWMEGKAGLRIAYSNQKLTRFKKPLSQEFIFLAYLLFIGISI